MNITLPFLNGRVNGSTIQGEQIYSLHGNQRYIEGTLPTSIGYTGQFADAVSGLDYYNARWYDPVMGQFLSAESVQGNAQGMDPYAYVAGNPETRTDPTGHCDFWCVLSLIGASLGIAGAIVGAIFSATVWGPIVALAGAAMFISFLFSFVFDGGNLDGANGQGTFLGELVAGFFGALGGWMASPSVASSLSTGGRSLLVFFWGSVSQILSAGISKGYSTSSSQPVPVAAPTPTLPSDPNALYDNQGAIGLLQMSVSLDEKYGVQNTYNSDVDPHLDYRDNHVAAKLAESNPYTSQLNRSDKQWQNWEYSLWERWAFSTNNISSDSWLNYQAMAVNDYADQMRVGKELEF